MLPTSRVMWLIVSQMMTDNCTFNDHSEFVYLDLTSAFSAVERKYIKNDLAVNERKKNYMLSTSRVMRHIGS